LATMFGGNPSGRLNYTANGGTVNWQPRCLQPDTMSISFRHVEQIGYEYTAKVWGG
jgi:hypothetical protein